MILDDATSEIYHAAIGGGTINATVMAGLREVIEVEGLVFALYSDRGVTYSSWSRRGRRWKAHRLAQVGRAMKQVGVHGDDCGVFSPGARPVRT